MATNTAAPRVPAYFLAHGGGALPILGDPGHKEMIQHLKMLSKGLPQQPRALVVVSAHWETDKPTVTCGKWPELVYDYAIKFPQPEAYQVKYPAPGDPVLARHIAGLLRAAGMDVVEEDTRGWDQGVFVPLALAFPAATLPVIELSVLGTLDPEAHLRMGEALAPLRDEGVLVLGSGMTFHNMSAFSNARQRANGEAPMPGEPHTGSAAKKSEVFNAALTRALTDPARTPEQRREALARWAELPEARFAHPREDHLMPLHVVRAGLARMCMQVAGAASCGVASTEYCGFLMGAKASSFKFA